jgi:23S rRNA (uracil1939-C5)-methyltransferase
MNETVIINIEKTASGGSGIGFHSGKALFVPYLFPGDKAAVEIRSVKNNCLFGTTVEIIDPSPMRVDPVCPNFSKCGGCSYCAISHVDEIAIKTELIKYNFSNIGRFSSEHLSMLEAIPSPSRTGCRSHASVKFSSGKTGFFMRDSNTLVPFPEGGCALLHPALRDNASQIQRDGSGELRIAVDKDLIFFMEPCGSITESEEGLIYTRRITDFFQNNLFLRPVMLKIAGSIISDNKNIDSFLDVGCGTGFFSLYLAKHGLHGTGIDTDRSCIESAKKNASINGLKNIKFIRGADSECPDTPGSASAVILDPPRTGLTRGGIKRITELKAPLVIYFSCDPATFARDSAVIMKNGYTMTKLAFIDMFPMTAHMEVVGAFKLC